MSCRSRSSSMSGSDISPRGQRQRVFRRAARARTAGSAPTSMPSPSANTSACSIDVLQLAHVARPGDSAQARQRRVGRPARRRAALVRGASLAMKCATRRGMSSLRSRSGGTVHGHDVQPVEEVLAEAPGARPRPARSRWVAETTRTSTLIGLLAADALELLLLQHAQQLELQRRRHVADLVEEQRALVGQLEAPELALDRAGERAPLVAEQLRSRAASRRAPRS